MNICKGYMDQHFKRLAYLEEFSANYHCGLKEVAHQAGYKAETLKSLENCSHLKEHTSMGGYVLVDSSPHHTRLLESTLEALNQPNTTPHNLQLTIQFWLYRN